MLLWVLVWLLRQKRLRLIRLHRLNLHVSCGQLLVQLINRLKPMKILLVRCLWRQRLPMMSCVQRLPAWSVVLAIWRLPKMHFKLSLT